MRCPVCEWVLRLGSRNMTDAIADSAYASQTSSREVIRHGDIFLTAARGGVSGDATGSPPGHVFPLYTLGRGICLICLAAQAAGLFNFLGLGAYSRTFS